ncbi:hypothetical protein ACO0RG_004089 [Hanseniaspora osmophila]|uniref:PX domain-containing protein n=1 Tax=Hanseniaspora osmophila TaxID=56408 RepID=A0A1E5RAX8_9ASCO|nr:hypothetical protein AWRI3579_g2720 [Hanseniaspora osmophila]
MSVSSRKSKKHVHNHRKLQITEPEIASSAAAIDNNVIESNTSSAQNQDNIDNSQDNSDNDAYDSTQENEPLLPESSAGTGNDDNANTNKRDNAKQNTMFVSPYVNVEIVDGTIIHTDNETGFSAITTAPSEDSGNTDSFNNANSTNHTSTFPAPKSSSGNSSHSKNQFVIWTVRISLQMQQQPTQLASPYHSLSKSALSSEQVEKQLYCYKRYSEFVVFRNQILKRLNRVLSKALAKEREYRNKIEADNDADQNGNTNTNSTADRENTAALRTQNRLVIKRLRDIHVPELPEPVSWWKCFSYNNINFSKNWLKHRQAGLEFFMCSVLLDNSIVEFCNDDIIKKFILNK